MSGKRLRDGADAPAVTTDGGDDPVPGVDESDRFERVKRVVFDWLGVEDGDPAYEDLPAEAHNELADLAVALIEAVDGTTNHASDRLGRPRKEPVSVPEKKETGGA